MPVPIRDDGTAGPSRHLLVFVHGFNSTSETCWPGLVHRLQNDKSISHEYDLATFQYDTELLRISIDRRLPSIREIASQFALFLEREFAQKASHHRGYIDATLVGHSMGGLVIQSYILQLLNAGRGIELDKIRQVIQFATPNFGSDFAGPLRRFLGIFASNPQLKLLASLSEERSTIHNGMRDLVVHANRRGRNSYPLPFYCFWGDSDKVVSEQSALGHFPHGEALKGHHSDLQRPTFQKFRRKVRNNDDQHYEAFRDVLVNPHGHLHIWEIESYLYSVRVSPLPHGTVIHAKHANQERVITTDNFARVIKEVQFGRNNRCQHPFPLKYRTRTDGWIEPNMPPHITTPDNTAKYDDTGFEVVAEVMPDKGSTSTLSMKVYKGFDENHRNFHMHIGQQAYYRRLKFTVDLQDYISSGWVVSRGPHLYFHLHDPGDHGLCAKREMLDPDPVHEYNPIGIWNWEFEHIKDGIVDLIWDVTPPGSHSFPESPSVIALKAGEHAIFGYGSLLSVASLERTLGRKYNGPFLTCDLIGWHRTWDVSMPNSTYSFFGEDSTWTTPEKILYLNIQRQQDSRVNGVLFVITDEDLEAFDRREWIYERVHINDDLRGVNITNGSAWAFVGKEEYRTANAIHPAHVAVRQTYLNILKAGIKALGPRFASAYERSTDPVPGRLVIADEKRDNLQSGTT
jgi:pimeloyl-ACP methyl ester carboxylesterase/cation transport regulator ChaC